MNYWAYELTILPPIKHPLKSNPRFATNPSKKLIHQYGGKNTKTITLRLC